MTSPTADTISTVAISEILGVTRGTITNWKSRKDDFPEPVAGTARSPLYDRQEIFRWLIANGKATEKQLRGLGVEKIIAQLFDALRNQGLDGEVLGAAICYVHLSRNGMLPESSCWTEHMPPDESANAIRAADQWTRSSALTYGLPIFAPLARALDVSPRSGKLVHHVLERISAVHDLEALNEAFLAAVRSTSYGEGSLPDDVATLVAQLVPEDARSVFDPYCTNGSLVVACAKERPGVELVAASPYRRSLESAVRWALIADINLDVIDGDVIEGIAAELRADAVVCNAPWGMRLSDHSRSMIRDTDPRWLFGTPVKDLHWALLQDAIYRLNPGGRAVVLCPRSVLFNTAGGARGIREGLLRHGCVEAVIAAPPGSLPNLGLALCVLVLARPGEATDTENVLLVDLDKPKKRGDRPDFPSAVHAYRTWIHTSAVDTDIDANHAFRAPVHEILAPQGSLDPTKWREAANRPDADALTESLDLAQKELENALAVTTTLDTRWTAQAGRASRYATIGSLSDISIHRGHPWTGVFSTRTLTPVSLCCPSRS
ncbi:N-6 DNA methylase [Rhodococcus hoagii]|nr:N-6 DNA methylase [Prescottella equi]